MSFPDVQLAHTTKLFNTVTPKGSLLPESTVSPNVTLPATYINPISFEQDPMADHRHLFT